MSGMKIDTGAFKVEEGAKVTLKKWPTVLDPVYDSKEQYQELLSEQVTALSSLQGLL